METHRFHPDPRAAHRENLFTAAVTAVLVPALLYFAEGERSPVVLGVFGGLGAGGVLAFYTWRSRRKGLQSLEITPEQVTVKDRSGERTLWWSEVREARHAYRGGEHWVLRARDRRRTLVLRLDGYSGEESGRIGELITRYTSHTTP